MFLASTVARVVVVVMVMVIVVDGNWMAIVATCDLRLASRRDVNIFVATSTDVADSSCCSAKIGVAGEASRSSTFADCLSGSRLLSACAPVQIPVPWTLGSLSTAPHIH